MPKLYSKDSTEIVGVMMIHPIQGGLIMEDGEVYYVPDENQPSEYINENNRMIYVDELGELYAANELMYNQEEVAYG